MIFKHFLCDKVAKILKSNEPPARINTGIPLEITNKFSTLKVEALICLRLAVKMNEKQMEMYERNIIDRNGRQMHIFKSLCTEIVSSILVVKDEIFDPRSTQSFDTEIKDYQTYMETQILKSCNWNLNLPNGYDQMQALLKLSNGQYDFNKLVNFTSQCALHLVFFTFPDSVFSFNAVPQSTIFVTCLKAACLHFGWD